MTTDEQENIEDDITIMELAENAGFSDEWIEEELFNTVGMIGAMALDDDKEGGAHTIKFITSDDISEIEISIRRIPKKRLH